MPTPNEQKYYVISGTYDQYKQFVEHKIRNFTMQRSQFVWVGSHTAIRGIKNPHGWFVGTFMKRDDLRDILMTLSISYSGGETMPRILNKIWSNLAMELT